MKKNTSDYPSNKWKKRVRLNYATTHSHLPPSTATHHQPKYIHHHTSPHTNSINISTTVYATHQQLKYIHLHPAPPTDSQIVSTTIHYHPPTAKIYPPLHTTTQNISKKKPFYKKDINPFMTEADVI